MSELRGKWWSTRCEIHGYHWPPIHATVWHHVHPLGLGGPDIAENMVEMCNTGHVNIHVALDYLLDMEGRPVKGKLKGFTRKELALAWSGYHSVVKRGQLHGDLT